MHLEKKKKKKGIFIVFLVWENIYVYYSEI